MRHFFNLLFHEFRTLFIAPSTYAAAVFFLGLMGWVFWRIIWQFSLASQDQLPSEVFFQLFWLPVFFVVPLLTMKSIAGERRRGTLETLMTTPVTTGEVVLSKFLAAYLFYCTLWFLTLGFPLLVSFVLESELSGARLINAATMAGGFSFIAISGVLFVAIGIFSSSLSRSQFLAGMLCSCILFMLIVGVRGLHHQAVPLLPWMEQAIEYLQVFAHLEDFSHGVLDTRPIIFYLSNAALVLGISTLIVESRA